MGFIVYLAIVVLIFLLIHFTYKYFTIYQKYIDLKRELNNQDLHYHLKKVRELGYDFTIKPDQHQNIKKPNKDRSTSKSKKSSSSSTNTSKSKNKKTKSFNELLK